MTDPTSAADVRASQVTAEGSRSVAIGGSVQDATIVTGDYYAVAEPQPVRLTRGTWRAWAREHATLGGALAAALLAVLIGGAAITLTGALQAARPRAPVRMTGDLNIAVAAFGASDTRVGSDFADSTARALDASVRTLGSQNGPTFDIQVRGPEELGSLAGSTAEQRAAQAAALADRINANLVLYGTVADSSQSSSVSTQFYVARSLVPDAEELAGQYELGTPLTRPSSVSNPGTRAELRDGVLKRTSALASFIMGLGAYGQHNFGTAITLFQAAIDVTLSEWPDAQGKEVLYVFLGNAYGRANNLDAAAAQYDHALQINPEFARARLGAAEMLFQRSKSACEPGHIDANGVEASLDRYADVLAATVQSPRSPTRAKVALGRAHAHACLSQALVGNHWAEAEQEFGTAIAALNEPGAADADNLKAEAYAGLGYVHMPYTASDPDAQARYHQAESDFLQASQLSSLPAVKANSLAMLGFIDARLNDFDQASNWYSQAIAVAPDEASRTSYTQQLGEVRRTPPTSAPPAG